jgi:uncharacterized protein
MGTPLRASSYIFFADSKAKNETLLIHGIYGTIFFVSRQIAECFRTGALESLPQLCPEDLLRSLHSHKYLTSLTPPEEHSLFISVAREKHRQALLEQRPAFAIIPTYECNLRCVYCFQPHSLHGQSAVITPNLISAAVSAIRRAVEHYCESLQAACSFVDIKLWGGEPLLRKNRDIVLRLVSVLTEKGCKVRAVTNGTEIDEFLEILSPTKLYQLQITLDGVGPIHDQRRPAANRVSTFNQIVSNIGLALSRQVAVGLRVNVDRANQGALDSLNSLIDREGWHSYKHFSCYTSPVTPVQGIVRNSLLPGGQHFRILTNARSTGSCAHIMQPGGYLRYVARHFVDHGAIPADNASYCDANKGYKLLDCNGLVFACENEAGNPAAAIGSYEKGELALAGPNADKWTSRSVADIPECSRCAVALLCGGGCGYNAALTTGSVLRSYCDGFKGTVAEFLPHYIAEAQATSASGCAPKC